MFRRRSRPRFSFITAVYRSAPYLPDYLDSLASLTGGHDDLEMLFVDDGSPDNSVPLIEAWIRRTGAPGRVIRKPHGGSVTARNTGLEHARGEWVSFPDPDDALDSDYLAAARSFLADVGSPALLAPKVERFTDDPRNSVDDHPLGYRYHSGRRLVHLAAEPRFFHTHAPSGFYKREVIARAALRLDPRLNAGFEDAAFAGEYLLQFDDPVIGVVPDATYRYRRRSNSVTGTMWSKPARYTAVPEHGYLPLLQTRTPAPAWLQLMVAYDLIWYFYEYDQPDSPNRAIDAPLAAKFLSLLDQVLGYIDEPLLSAYPLHPIPLRIRTALAARKTGRITIKEAMRDGATLTFFTADRDAQIVLTLDGLVTEPSSHTQRPVEYYGEVFLIEHALQVDGDGAPALAVNDTPYAITPSP